VLHFGIFLVVGEPCSIAEVNLDRAIAFTLVPALESHRLPWTSSLPLSSFTHSLVRKCRIPQAQRTAIPDFSECPPARLSGVELKASEIADPEGKDPFPGERADMVDLGGGEDVSRPR
jgi:hypothetical protein